MARLHLKSPDGWSGQPSELGQRMTTSPRLHLICGKVAAGKSTLAAKLSAQPKIICLSEDDWLEALFSDQMKTLDDYLRCAAKLQVIVAPHVVSLLEAGVSVVLDFPANTQSQRRWLKGIAETARVPHILHFLDVPNEVCLSRLHARNAAGAHPFMVSDADFHAVTDHFVAPVADEGVVVYRYDDASGEATEILRS